MITRRSLLRVLLSFGGLTALISACKHRAPYAQKDKSEDGDGGDGGDGGGGGGGGSY